MKVKRILVVDDSPTERHVLNAMLTKAGYEVVPCDSGEDAIVKAKHLKPDLILMDVVMPGLNGFQATRAISRDADTKDIPIVLCTSKGQETDKIWGMRQGARDYVVKPVHRDELLAKIAKPFAHFAKLSSDEYAISCKINTKKGSERIVRAAFEFAKKHGRKKVTIVHKANVVRATDGLFLEEAKKVAKEFPGIETDDANIDAIGMWLLKNPFNYDVLVAPNLYGDIISDLCAQMVGGLGFGCSGNIGEKLAVFEPTHGSAPKHAGKQKANPIATILAAKMMLDWLGEREMAERIERAVAEVIKEGKIRTYDMGGSATTMQMAEAVAHHLAGTVAAAR